MQPITPRPQPKSWQQWRLEMETYSLSVHKLVALGNADLAGLHAQFAAHAAFYI